MKHLKTINQIIYKEAIGFPKEWDQVEDDSIESSDLGPALKEFDSVVDSFLEISDKFSNKMIFRIENTVAMKLSDYDEQNPTFFKFIKWFEENILTLNRTFEVYFSFSDLEYTDYLDLIKELKSPIKKMSLNSFKAISIDSGFSVERQSTGWCKIKFKKST